ncbi:alpha/beta hydrolase [uncultured Sphingomonas sp.]|uniref:alpha/beta fold hydrolase n=1 Tax=uncultured Sphingomonas sp. TaxID=158754 RepID=UPI0025E3F6D1|nr:alpha/beta hydrolase [uncultured Sphingomonas sp.]
MVKHRLGSTQHLAEGHRGRPSRPWATLAEPDSGTFDSLVGSVERYIAEAALPGVDVIGSSMGARIVLELARRGLVGNVVALDPGGFWRGWERTFFRTTIGASGRLLRAIRPGLPVLSRNPASRTALLAQLSARLSALDGANCNAHRKIECTC